MLTHSQKKSKLMYEMVIIRHPELKNISGF